MPLCANNLEIPFKELNILVIHLIIVLINAIGHDIILNFCPAVDVCKSISGIKEPIMVPANKAVQYIGVLLICVEHIIVLAAAIPIIS